VTFVELLVVDAGTVALVVLVLVPLVVALVVLAAGVVLLGLEVPFVEALLEVLALVVLCHVS
jgi:hypothetical protein